MDVPMRRLDFLKWMDYNDVSKVCWCVDEGRLSNSISSRRKDLSVKWILSN